VTDDQIVNRVEYLKSIFNLQLHPEGGYYKETYRAKALVSGETLVPSKSGSNRSASTMIYFLVTPGSFSALHSIRSDEGWHFYEGTGLEILEINPANNEASITVLGSNFENGQKPQHWIPAGHFFGSRSYPINGYALVGCTVAPGFDFDDFTLPSQKELFSLFPEHRDLIALYSRN